MNIKKLGNFRKKVPESAHPMICLLLQVMTSSQENKHANRLLEC